MLGTVAEASEALSSTLVDERKQKQKMCLRRHLFFSMYMTGFLIYMNLIFEIHWGNCSHANVVFSTVRAASGG